MKAFFTNNRERLFESLKPGEMAILFCGEAPRSTADSFYRFRPNKNFFYFTGLKREHFVLTILKQESGGETKLFIEEPDYDVEKWIGRKMKKDEAQTISGIEEIEFLDKFKPYLNKAIYDGKVTKVLLDLERLAFEGEEILPERFARTIRDKYPHVALGSVHPIASALRVIKSDYEIDQIRSAVMLTKLGLEEVLRTLRPNLYEYQVEATFNHTIMMNGADGNAFDTIAASGENAVILHYVENADKIGKNDLILLDLGAQYNQYASDVTRTFPASGRFTERQRALYEVVLKANKEVQAIMKPGLPFADLNKRSKEVIGEGLKELGLISTDEELGKYYYHGVGHYMGLDTHDLGDREVTLEPGMVITCEPGVYVAEEGIGIRIEDDILITEDGPVNLTAGIIKEVDEIEAFMAKK